MLKKQINSYKIIGEKISLHSIFPVQTKIYDGKGFHLNQSEIWRRKKKENYKVSRIPIIADRLGDSMVGHDRAFDN